MKQKEKKKFERTRPTADALKRRQSCLYVCTLVESVRGKDTMRVRAAIFKQRKKEKNEVAVVVGLGR